MPTNIDIDHSTLVVSHNIQMTNPTKLLEKNYVQSLLIFNLSELF